MHLEPEHLAPRREDQDVGVRRGDEQVLDEVLLARRRADLASSAAALRPVEAHGVPLDVALVRDRDDHVLFDDEVLDGERAHLVDDLGAARIGVLRADGTQLLDDDPRDLAFVGEDLPVALDRPLGLGVFLEDLAALEAGEALQAHLEDRLGLHLGEPERRHQAVARGGRVGRAADEGDRMVEMLDRDPEAGQDVQSLLRLAEIVCRPAGDDLAAMLDEDAQRILQVEHPGPALDDGQHVHPEGVLQRCVLVELVQEHLGHRVPLEVDHDPHAVAIGLVAQVGDAVELPLVDQLRHALDQP